MQPNPIGRLTVELWSGAGPDRPANGARVLHTPGAPVGALLAGRPGAFAVTIVPAMLNLCAAAHRRAATSAVGMPPATEATIPAATEIPRDHALAILRDWPACVGLAADGDGMREIGGMTGSRDPEGARAALRRRLFGPMERLGERTPRELEHWLADGDTATARVLAEARMILAPLNGLNPSPPPSLEDTILLATDRSAAPTREASWLHRVVNAPLIEALEEREGRGPFTRLLARLLDLARHLEGNGTEAGAGESPEPDDADTAMTEVARGGWGVGWADASRGPLAHLARMVGDTIHAYHVVTPTDWNAAPGGPLERMLRAAATAPWRDGTDLDRLAAKARLIIASVDPCVPTTLTLNGKAVPVS